MDAADEVHGTGVDVAAVPDADVHHDGAVRADSSGTETSLDGTTVVH